MTAQTTYLDLKTRVLDILGKSDTTTGNRVDNWLNMGYHDFVLRELWPFREVKGSLSISAGTPEYSLSGTFSNIDAQNIVSVAIQGSSSAKLKFIPYNQLQETQPDYTAIGQDLPRYYYVKDGNIGFWPTPVAAYTVYIEYYKVPTDMSSDGDEPIIPLSYRQALIHFALSHEHDYNGDPDLAQKAMNSYEDFITKARLNLLSQVNDSNDFVITGPESFVSHTGLAGEVI